MRHSPKVTFLIPCFNVEKYLVDALNCVVNQTYQNLEIILIDDGSTDNTLTILNQYAAKDSRIILVKNEKNIGLINTLNKGIDLVSGEFIARFDADDIIGVDRIEKQVELINKNDSIDLITSYVDYITPSGKFHSNVESFYCYTFYSIKFLNLFECPLVHAGMLIKTSILKENKYTYQKDYLHIEDYELFTRLINKKINIFVNTSNDQKYLYRRNPTSVSNKNKNIQVENSIGRSLVNIKSTLNYPIEYEVLKAIVLKCNIEWSRELILKVFSEFAKMKKMYLLLEKSNLSTIDYKLIEEWYYLRSQKIITTILIKGSFTCKILAIYYFIKNFKFFGTAKFYKNLYSRIIYIFNSIKYKN